MASNLNKTSGITLHKEKRRRKKKKMEKKRKSYTFMKENLYFSGTTLPRSDPETKICKTQ